MRFERIKEYPTRIFNVFRRFPLPIFFAALTASLCIAANIHFDSLFKPFDKNITVWEWLLLYPIGAMGLTFAVALFFETSPHKERSIPAQALSALLWAALSAFLLHCYGSETSSSFVFVWYACFSAIFCAPILPFFKRKDDKDLSLFLNLMSKETSIAFGAALALCGLLCGLLLCIFNLFDIKEPGSSLYLSLLYFSLFFLAPLLTFSAVPRTDDLKPEQEAEQGKIRGAISKYILPIIVSVFLLIMYAHIVKILVRSFKDAGDISYFAASALTAVICLAVIQFPKRTKIFPIASIPLLVIFAIDSVRLALQSHSHAVNLYLVLYCLWCAISIAIILYTPERRLRWLSVSFCALLMIGSIGPQRVFNIAKLIPPKDIQKENAKEFCADNSKGSVQKEKNKRVEFTSPWKTIDIPPEYSKAMYVDLFFFNKPSVTAENGMLSFPINKYGQEGKQITRFEVPIQSLFEFGEIPNLKPILLQNDSAAYVITEFKFEQGTHLFFSSKGVAFFKKEPTVPDDVKGE